MSEKILAGDIGGTNTRLGLYENEKLILIQKFSTTTKNVNEALQELTKKHKIKGICLGCAGFIHKGKVKLTNNELTINSKELTKKLGIKTILINDFEALGYYAKKIGIKKGMVIGPGTGLGKVFVNNDVISSEGGLADIPFYRNEQKYQEYFYKTLKKNPTYEDVISGEGLILLKKFHSKKKLKFEELKPENILINTKDATNKKTINDFTKFLGRFIKNSYIDFHSEKILLAGGIITKHKWLIKTETFQKEIKQDLMKPPQITIAKHKHPGIIGAYTAHRELK